MSNTHFNLHLPKGEGWLSLFCFNFNVSNKTGRFMILVVVASYVSKKDIQLTSVKPLYLKAYLCASAKLQIEGTRPGPSGPFTAVTQRGDCYYTSLQIFFVLVDSVSNDFFLRVMSFLMIPQCGIHTYTHVSAFQASSSGKILLLAPKQLTLVQFIQGLVIYRYT